MTDPYSDAYSEFLTPAEWTGDCLKTLAEHTTGRADWETVTTFYPMLNGAQKNSGPSNLPLDVTQIEFVEPVTPTHALSAPFFGLTDENGSPLPLEGGQAQGYLFKTQNTADPTDDYVIALGSPNRDLIQARGAEPGDRLCVFDNGHRPIRLGCLESIGNVESSFALPEVTDWQPQITVTPVTSRTFVITVSQVAESGLNVQLLPAYGRASAAIAMSPVASGFVQTLTLDDPAFGGWARVWVPGSHPDKEAMTEFSVGEGWGGRSRAWGGRSRAWGGRSRAWGAPVTSGDGQVIIFNLENIFADEANYTLQTLSTLPTLPTWLTPVGQAYRFSTSAALPRSSILFQYLQRDVPSGQEFGLRVYYSPDEGQTWQRLETELDTDRNLASAEMRGAGIYALISTIEIPAFQSGWNNFGYPVPGTRPVPEALASIDGYYTSIYNYEPVSTSPWTLYDKTVVDQHPEFGSFVNDLTHLEFGRGYWLYATQPVTLYLGVDNANPMLASSTQFPPATFYGWVIPAGSFAPTVGTAVTAWINGTQCGETTIAALNGQLAYKLQVASEGFAPNNCGTEGRNVVFKVGSQTIVSDRMWDNRQAWFHALSYRVSIYLPVVLR